MALQLILVSRFTSAGAVTQDESVQHGLPTQKVWVCQKAIGLFFWEGINAAVLPSDGENLELNVEENTGKPSTQEAEAEKLQVGETSLSTSVSPRLDCIARTWVRRGGGCLYSS